ncbi:MAG: family 43 glycosylhydrolase [Treponema sp.]|nr:family 43 glycosylhydrolase [Treponema sp.]
MKRITIFGLVLVLLAGIGLVLSCEGPAGPSGKAGLPGLDGTGGSDGYVGTDGIDGTDGTDAIDPVLKAEIEAYIGVVSAQLGDLDRVFVDLDLPSGNGEVKVAWLSTNPGVLGNNGFVSPMPNHSVNLILTGFFSKGGTTITQVYMVTVPASSELTLEESTIVAFYMEGRDVVIDDFMDYYHYEVLLPNLTTQGSTILWTSSHATYPVVLDDRIANFERSRIKVTDANNFDGYITLTATFTHPSRLEHSFSKNYLVRVVDKHFTGYLMTYFGGSPMGEQTRFALTRDPGGTEGWQPLNSNSPVIWGMSDTGGVRDPYVQRGHDGYFYLTGTDMHSGIWGGWSSNRGLVLAKSRDLVNWTGSKVNMTRTYPGNFSTIVAAWAPEFNYDRRTGKYQIIFSTNGSAYAAGLPGNHMTFRAYINSDFSGFEHEPVRFFQHPLQQDTIDCSIYYYNDLYYLAWKNEAGYNATTAPFNKHQGLASSKNINGPWEVIRMFQCQEDGSIQTEGAQWFRQIGTETFVMFWDRFSGAPSTFERYGYRKTNDFITWDPPIDTSQDMPAGLFPYPTSAPFLTNSQVGGILTAAQRSRASTMDTPYQANHGSIIPLTEEEYQRLANTEWPDQAAGNPTVTVDATLRLHYTFTGTDTEGTAGDGTGSNIINRANPGTHDGKVMWLNAGGAGVAIEEVNGIGTFYTGTSTGTPGAALTGNTAAYIDMGAAAGSIVVGQNDFTIATYVWFDGAGTNNVTGDGNLVWALTDTDNAAQGSPANNTGKYIAHRSVAQRTTVSRQGNANLSSVSYGENLPRGQWVHVMYRQAGEWGTLYNDGVPVATSRMRLRSTNLVDPGQTPETTLTYNWIGRSMFRADNMMRRARYADFRMYSGAISEAQIAALSIPATLATLNGP